jgi:hypothetical protein
MQGLRILCGNELTPPTSQATSRIRRERASPQTGWKFVPPVIEEYSDREISLLDRHLIGG